MQRRHVPIGETDVWLTRVVRGYLNYHAVRGNLKRLGAFREEWPGMDARATAPQPAFAHDVATLRSSGRTIHPQGPRLSSSPKPALHVVVRDKQDENSP